MNIKRVILTVMALLGLVVIVGGVVLAVKHFSNPYVGIWSNGTEEGRLIIEKNGDAYITSRTSEVESFGWERGGDCLMLTHCQDPNERALCRLTSDGHLSVYIPWDAREPSQILMRVKK